MVRKIFALLLISIQTAQAIEPGLALFWSGSKSSRCQNLVEAFLAELRPMAANRSIELELEGDRHSERGLAQHDPEKPMRELAVSCAEPDSIRVGDRDPNEAYPNPVTLRYLSKASGFDASDWLPFQQRFLRPLSLSALTLPVATKPVATVEMMAPQTSESPSLLKKWWFWTALAGVGAGIFALTRSSEDSSRVQVEIR